MDWADENRQFAESTYDATLSQARPATNCLLDSAYLAVLGLARRS